MKNQPRRLKKPTGNPGQRSLFDLVPQVKPLDGSVFVGGAGSGARPGVQEAEESAALPVEGRFKPPVNYVSDEEEPI